ncbi:methyltransferase-UbiE family [Pseudohyphozyma bogoriensis]|nr:methyltransferase-UbiE family [Pseudohyphozyma bogoriensis]
MPTSSNYTLGQNQGILNSFAKRSIASSAVYLEPHLLPSHRLLDAGCGPGSISIDFASHVKEVVGVDQSEKAIEAARKNAREAGTGNVEFQVADINELPFGEGEFDVVHVHQVLLYLPSPLKTLQELRRVTAPGGVIAIREADFGTSILHPPSPPLERFRELFYQVTRKNGGEPETGRRLLEYALKAGFERESVTCSSSSVCFSTKEEIERWGKTWSEASVNSDFARTAVEEGFAKKEELEEISEAWKVWMGSEGAWSSMTSGEILCRV